MIHLYRRNQSLLFPRLGLDETGKGRQDAYLTCAFGLFFLLSFLALVIEPLQKFTYIREEDLLPFEKFLKCFYANLSNPGSIISRIKICSECGVARKPKPPGTPVKINGELVGSIYLH